MPECLYLNGHIVTKFIGYISSHGLNLAGRAELRNTHLTGPQAGPPTYVPYATCCLAGKGAGLILRNMNKEIRRKFP